MKLPKHTPGFYNPDKIKKLKHRKRTQRVHKEPQNYHHGVIAFRDSTSKQIWHSATAKTKKGPVDLGNYRKREDAEAALADYYEYMQKNKIK